MDEIYRSLALTWKPHKMPWKCLSWGYDHALVLAAIQNAGSPSRRSSDSISHHFLFATQKEQRKDSPRGFEKKNPKLSSDPQDGTALRYAGEFMRQDRRFVLEALRQEAQGHEIGGLPWPLLESMPRSKCHSLAICARGETCQVDCWMEIWRVTLECQISWSFQPSIEAALKWLPSKPSSIIPWLTSRWTSPWPQKAKLVWHCCASSNLEVFLIEM